MCTKIETVTLLLQVTTNVSLRADNGVKYPARHKIRAIALSDADLVSCPLQYSRLACHEAICRPCVRPSLHPSIVCIWRLPIRMGMCSVEVWLVLGAGAGDHIWENEVMHRHASDV